jgi:hypothetical protein
VSIKVGALLNKHREAGMEVINPEYKFQNRGQVQEDHEPFSY